MKTATEIAATIPKTRRHMDRMNMIPIMLKEISIVEIKRCLLGEITSSGAGIDDDGSTADGADDERQENGNAVMMGSDHHGHVSNGQGLQQISINVKLKFLQRLQS